MRKIDMHCHLYPEGYVKEVKKRNLFSTHNLPEWVSPEDRIADMNKYGIERQVLSPSSPFVYFEDDELNLHLAQLTNNCLADVCRKYPDRFSGFVNVPLGNIGHAIVELKRAVKEPGMIGVALGTRVRKKPISYPEFGTFFEEVDKLGIPIMIHPMSPIGVDDLSEYRDFNRSVGFLWETTMTIGEMAIRGLFERYKKIKWILSHLGGALPFVYTSMETCQKRNLDEAYVPPKPLNEYFKGLYVDTARLLTSSILACAIDLYGEDHIMFGTDIPYAYDVTSQNVSRLDQYVPTNDLKQKVFYSNAKKLLRL